MTEKYEDGGPAFPLSYKQQNRGGEESYVNPGMALWDFYFAHAAGGYLAGPTNMSSSALIEYAAGAADLMIEQRKKRFFLT